VLSPVEDHVLQVFNSLYLSRFRTRVSTEVTFWHSAEYGSDFRLNSGEIPRNSAEFRGISPELSRNHFRSQKIPRNSVSAEFRGHPIQNLLNWLTTLNKNLGGEGPQTDKQLPQSHFTFQLF
jgi:hypothetical protein